ncbi:MAG: radical SAM protein, partial [Halobacteriota archaeon]|nr:radical SAM protein [Halobacteriota archaeon]
NCCYCDTPLSKKASPLCRVEQQPGSSEFELVENPIEVDDIISHIRHLMTSDTKTVSYTGGEPLIQEDFLYSVADRCRRNRWKNFLETSGFSVEKFLKVVKLIDYAAIDVKLPDHQAVIPDEYGKLYANEISCIEASCESRAETIVKVVILPGTDSDCFTEVCKDLGTIEESSSSTLHFVIQPVTLVGAMTRSFAGEVFELSERAGLHLEDVRVIPQVHKVLGVL